MSCVPCMALPPRPRFAMQSKYTLPTKVKDRVQPPARTREPGGSLLRLGVAADADELARDVARGVGGEEHRHVADLVRVDPAAHRDVPQRVRLGLGERDAGLVGG